MHSSVARHEHHIGCGRSSLWAFWRGPWARSATRSAWETMFFLPSGAWRFPVQFFCLNQSNDKWCRLGLKKARGFWMKFRSQVAFWEVGVSLFLLCRVCPPCVSVGLARMVCSGKSSETDQLGFHSQAELSVGRSLCDLQWRRRCQGAGEARPGHAESHG